MQLKLYNTAQSCLLLLPHSISLSLHLLVWGSKRARRPLELARVALTCGNALVASCHLSLLYVAKKLKVAATASCKSLDPTPSYSSSPSPTVAAPSVSSALVARRRRVLKVCWFLAFEAPCMYVYVCVCVCLPALRRIVC